MNEGERYRKNYDVDGWPILDGVTHLNLTKDQVIERLNELDRLLRDAEPTYPPNIHAVASPLNVVPHFSD